MAEIDNTGRPAYVYNSSDGKWYEVAGKVDPTANYNWTGTHTFNNPVTMNNAVVASKRFNVFTNQTSRSSSMQTLGSSDRGHISFLQNDAASGTALNRFEYWNGSEWIGIIPVGTIMPYGGPTAPPGWLICDGSSYVRANYQDLYNTISTTYGGGTTPGTTFQVPNLTGRVAVGAGDSELGSLAGNSGGWKKSQSHTHTHSHTHGVASPYTAGTSDPGNHLHSISHDHTTGGQPTGRNLGGSYGGAGSHQHRLASEDKSGVGSSSGTGLTRKGGLADYTGDYTGYAGGHDHSVYVDVAGHSGNSGYGGAHTHVTVHQNSSTTSSYPTDPSGSAGSTSTIGNMPPYLTVNYIIRY